MRWISLMVLILLLGCHSPAVRLEASASDRRPEGGPEERWAEARVSIEWR